LATWIPSERERLVLMTPLLWMEWSVAAQECRSKQMTTVVLLLQITQKYLVLASTADFYHFMATNIIYHTVKIS